MPHLVYYQELHASFRDEQSCRTHLCSCNYSDVVQALKVWGMSLATETSKQFAEGLDAAVVEGDPYFNKTVRIMATRCMTQAKYFSSGQVAQSGFLHYGLAAPIYTHFTSPIRR